MDNKELSGEIPEYGEEKKAKKGNDSLVVAVSTVLFMLVIGLCVYIAVSVSHMVPKDGPEDKEYEAETEDPWKEILGDDYKGDGQEVQPEETLTVPPYAYPNYPKDTFTGPYYDGVVDCIDYTVSYDIERKFCNVEEPQNNVSIHTSYICLGGEIPGVEEINRRLEEDATFFAENYKKNKKDMLEALDEEFGIDASIRSYVTYNTENMISIVVRRDIMAGGMCLDVSLKCYNINTDTGTILDSTSMLELEEGFGQEFRDRSNRQNGSAVAEPFSDLQIEQLLADEQSLIFFYTPLGAELGYNYNEGESCGWITITLQDYEEFVKQYIKD